MAEKVKSDLFDCDECDIKKECEDKCDLYLHN